jgi:hypothetical protein
MCNIGRNEEGEINYKAAISSFASLTTLLIRGKGADTLRKAKIAHTENVKYYKKALQKRFLIPKGKTLDLCTTSNCYSGITGHERDRIIENAVQIYNDSIKVKIRFLERDIKRQYLEPSLIGMLRPQLVDLPRRIDLEPKDAFHSRIKLRMEHLSTIVDVFRTDKCTEDTRVLELLNIPLVGSKKLGPTVVGPPL